MKGFVEIEINNIVITVAVSAIVGVSKKPFEGANTILTLNAPVYAGPSNLTSNLFLDIDYRELLARIEQAQR